MGEYNVVKRRDTMPSQLMLLHSKDISHCRLVRVPEDFEEHEVYRRVTGIISSVEQANPHYTWEDMADALEQRGFEVVEFIRGPMLNSE